MASICAALSASRLMPPASMALTIIEFFGITARDLSVRIRPLTLPPAPALHYGKFKSRYRANDLPGCRLSSSLWSTVRFGLHVPNRGVRAGCTMTNTGSLRMAQRQMQRKLEREEVAQAATSTRRELLGGGFLLAAAHQAFDEYAWQLDDDAPRHQRYGFGHIFGLDVHGRVHRAHHLAFHYQVVAIEQKGLHVHHLDAFFAEHFHW